jgi:hypothetical protein
MNLILTGMKKRYITNTVFFFFAVESFRNLGTHPGHMLVSKLSDFFCHIFSTSDEGNHSAIFWGIVSAISPHYFVGVFESRLKPPKRVPKGHVQSEQK